MGVIGIGFEIERDGSHELRHEALLRALGACGPIEQPLESFVLIMSGGTIDKVLDAFEISLDLRKDSGVVFEADGDSLRYFGTRRE